MFTDPGSGPCIVDVRWTVAAGSEVAARSGRNERAGADGKGILMGLGDKIGNAAEEAKGKVEEAAGKATDDRSLEAEGKGDQASANVKQAGEKTKDAVKDALD